MKNLVTVFFLFLIVLISLNDESEKVDSSDHQKIFLAKSYNYPADFFSIKGKYANNQILENETNDSLIKR